MMPNTKSDDVMHYYHVMPHANDDVVTSENFEKVLRKETGKYFELNPEVVGLSSICLKGSTRKLLLENGVRAWAFRPYQNAQSAVKILKEYLDKGKKMLDGESAPTKSSYRPELDASHELVSKEALHYQ